MTILDTWAQATSASMIAVKSNAITTVNAAQITTNYFEATAGNITGYLTNMPINLKLNTTVSGSTTLNINAFGVRNLKKIDTTGSMINIANNDLIANRYYLFVYDGTQFVLGGYDAGSSGSSGGGTTYSGSAPITISGSVISLNTTGITSGSYNKVLVDQWGRVTAGSVVSGGGSSGVWINVTDYGAFGNGSTVNTTSIQNAINAANVKGGCVYFPAGTYLTGSLTMYRNVTLAGDGKRISTIKSSSSGSLLTIATMGGDAGFYGGFDNIGFDGNSTGTTCIDITTAWELTMNKVLIENFTGVALNMKDVLTSQFYDCQFVYNGTGVRSRFVSSLEGNLNRFVNCAMGGNTVYGIDCTRGSLLVLEGCQIEQNGTIGNSSTGAIYYSSSLVGVGITINNCWFEANVGGANVYIDTPFTQNPTSSINNSVFVHNESINYGIFIQGITYTNNVLCKNCFFYDDATISDFYANGSNSYIMMDHCVGSSDGAGIISNMLDDSGVFSGTYLSANITVDSRGIITSAENGSSASSVGAPSNSPFVTTGSSTSLTNYRILTAGSNVTITTESSAIIINATSSGSGGGNSDWNSAGQTWTFNSADAPTYRFTTGGTDVSGIYSPGMKFKMTHNSSTKYFICTAVTGSLVTCYGGTDYILSGSTITNPYFSTSKSPFGFPLNPTKWTVSVSDTTAAYQSSPVGGTWYNLGSISISVPIGIWDVSYGMNAYVAIGSNGGVSIYSTLSTANNSESDVDFTAALYGNNTTQTTARIYVEKTLGVSSKITYYLNGKTASSSITDIDFRGDFSPTKINARCSYL
jgi:hypothetical protein